MWRVVSQTETETLAVGRVLGALARPGDLIAIDGPLGAGKTRLVRGIALGIGLDGGLVSSPTFVVVNEYTNPDADDPVRLFHLDAYRLSGPDDLETLGWDRIADGSAVVAVEWAERIAPALLEAETHREHPVWRVRMEPVPGLELSARRIEIIPPRLGLWSARRGAGDLRHLAAILGDHAPPPPSDAPLPRGWARCPTTGKPVPPDAPTFPFADEHARMADLGRWMSGAYTVSREITEDDLDTPPHPPA